ncbi:MAG TPA: RsmE family RNA methyltransferase [Flavobacteriales bacterium]|nr:RsmE family RNA methyltransferase [Flavobacteriales bacterium]
MHLFHCPSLAEGAIALPEEEAHHAVHVLRMKMGDHVGLLDGQGTRATAVLVELNKHRCIANITERVVHARERAANIHIAMAPTKQMERLEWFVEKATEVGVDRITPLITERTERSKLRLDRLQRVTIAAMKQSQRTWLPVIDNPISLKDLMNEALPTQRYFGWCVGEHTSLMKTYSPTTDAIVLIGPEGDLTSGEAELLQAKGFAAVSIGAARLRTETAALSTCTWMSLAQQR